MTAVDSSRLHERTENKRNKPDRSPIEQCRGSTGDTQTTHRRARVGAVLMSLGRKTCKSESSVQDTSAWRWGGG